MSCSIDFNVAPLYSLAFQQNQYPLITSLTLTLDEDDEPQRDIKITLTSDPQFFDDVVWQLDYLEPGQRIELQLKNVRPSIQALDELSDQIRTNLTLTATVNDEQLDRCDFETTMLPKNHWAGESNMAELLAAFSLPNAPYSEELVVKASQVLKRSGLPSQLDGYQSNTREKPYQTAEAIWATIQSESIAYINPSPTFASSGQRIRITEDIKQNKSAACLDLSMLFASVLERTGLNTVVALTKEHAFVGVWLIDDCFPLLTMDDPMAIRKRVAMRDLVVFETTLVTADRRVSFSQACDQANLLLGEGNEEEFVYAIDIAQGRKRQISPLPIRVASPVGGIDEPEDPAEVTIPPAPVMPPVRPDDVATLADTPETRVDQWQRKLLDLTKRNRLLNLAGNAVAVRLFCPDLGRLEDMLAAGDTFNFQASDDTPLANDSRGRSQEIFRFETGNSLQIEYAKGQLDKKTLVANDSKKRLESQLLSLYRKAKNDLEEGGSNTLFLSIGMLRWKESEHLDKSYRAPLILLPVELQRTSARSAIRIKQIKDEEPIFNSTLIEFLQQDYEINLNQFRTELPADESGVDVDLIWDVVRQKVKDAPGFEVVEELVLSTFSFAKYLMWRDLKDRVDDLKSNVFVEHLIERPQEVFTQTSQFIEQKDVDQKIRPSELFAPLNADSSQMVAIEASGHPQDFVMEGPPGTGKSETIANIICHNLAVGRRVLFVAEKMAALNVVYRRLQKVGVGHLCLELHSNKANKTAVLEQLRRSWQGRQRASQTNWKEKAEELFRIRSALNVYVDELHKPSQIGISPRKAISRSTRFKSIHPLELNWPKEISQSPLKSEEQYQLLLDTAKDLSLAFSDLEGLDLDALAIVKNQDWSNSWQSEIVASARRLSTALNSSLTPAQELLSKLELGDPNALTLKSLHALKAISQLLARLQVSPTGIVFGGRVRDRLENLESLARLKQSGDEKLAASGAGLEWSEIMELPTSDWAASMSEAEMKVWPFSGLKRMSVRSAMKKAGVHSYKESGIANQLNEIKKLGSEVVELSRDFESDRIWTGWDTTAESLRELKEKLNEWAQALRVLIDQQQLDAPATLTKLKDKLDAQWEFLESNVSLFSSAEAFIASENELMRELDSFKVLADSTEISIEHVGSLKEALFALTNHEQELNYWCRWLASKQLAVNSGLETLCEALESGRISADAAVDNTITAIHRWLAPILIDRSEVLKRFSATSHEALISDFRELDAEVAKTTSDYIVAKTASLIPEPGAQNTPPAYGVLSTELAKKTKHKPVRQLVEEMGDALLNLTPCMMMSPLSVAQFLPASFTGFDLVVFDEASQITVWDAVGAIARGRNSIIVGDPKQMPPTNFFNRTSGDDDEEDLESILDQALAARLPHHRLTGHYRSRHESLIAFSNSHYYENSLVTFPSAETKNTAVTFHKVDGLYAKGKGRNNPVEAKALADEIVRRLQDSKLSKLSIGVVTLNTEQKVTVEDELDDRRRKYPELERFFQGDEGYDPIFVKNLESVQGDERDIIILSVGYGPTEPGAKTMSMNFGPLNKEGGHRRLNVAVTRATTEVLVFASFDAGMIDLTRTQATAVKHLKAYLEFAELGPEALARESEASHGVDQFDSDFEQGVAFALRERGWTVQTQIGVGKFRIDMGIVHPDAPGIYLAGVECDGATYHSSPAARDRDRVRQIILENLGWSIVRLWSTDYFINPERAIERIDGQLNALLDASRNAEEEPEEVEEVVEQPLFIDPNQLDKSKFFDDGYSATVVAVIKEILEERNGIFLTELASEVSKKFNLARTSEAQLEHIEKLIKPWAGISRKIRKNPTIWMTPDDCVEIIEWRGIAPWGVPRKWQEICYEEQLGAAKYALQKKSYDPIGAMKTMFQLSRLNAGTSDEFSTWVENYTMFERDLLL